MSFDLNELRGAVARHGTVTRVVVAEVKGSAPREVGASMLVWETGQLGTIGGGTLELEAVAAARKGEFLRRVPLGPALGQCCGGAVTLVGERVSEQDLATIETAHVRRVYGNEEMPLAMRRAMALARNAGHPAPHLFQDGWLMEPVAMPTRQLWVYGAGHVGRAIVSVLAPLPDMAVTWIDTAPDRYPDTLPKNVTQLVAANPADVIRHAPKEAEHLILTYSHAFDLEICHRLLGHGFAWAGLIGSDTKWARFQARLRNLGHSNAQISRICCPIGQKSLGKTPQAIAIGVAASLISREAADGKAAMGERE